ncbi:hypothetical protein ACO0RG_002441 [Hanseniaspora osmophila]
MSEVSKNESSPTTSNPSVTPSMIYQLSQEYYHHAKKVFHMIKTEEQLQQYYTLIQQCLRCLMCLKTKPLMLQEMTLQQELLVTLQLSEMLIEHTVDNRNVAVLYLENFKIKLLNLRYNVEDLMIVEFTLICVLPLSGQKSEHALQLALKNCNRLLKKLAANMAEETQGNAVLEKWLLIFKFARIQLSLAVSTDKSLPSVKTSLKTSQVHMFVRMYQDLLSEIPTGQYALFRDYLTLSLVSLKLEHNYDAHVLQKIPSLITKDSPFLNAWWQLLDVCRMIKLDENIYDKLNEFVELFKTYKKMLNSMYKFDFLSDICSFLQIDCCIFTLFHLKKILLLMQSVSFLLNHHDPTNNHSLRFLPKLLEYPLEPLDDAAVTTPTILKMNCALGEKIIHLTEYYHAWQSKFLEMSKPVKQMTTCDAISSYMDILDETDIHNRIHLFVTFIQRSDVNSELKIFSSINLYLLFCAIQDFEVLQPLENAIENHCLVQENNLIQCLWTLVWNMTHFKPFMDLPVLCHDNDFKNAKLAKLQKFLQVNVLREAYTEEESKKFKIKKSQLIFVLLEYVAGKVLVNETEKQNELSTSCFKLATHCKNINRELCYVIGLWCFNNSILLSDQKQELKMKMKLKKLVKELEPSLKN